MGAAAKTEGLDKHHTDCYNVEIMYVQRDNVFILCYVMFGSVKEMFLNCWLQS